MTNWAKLPARLSSKSKFIRIPTLKLNATCERQLGKTQEAKSKIYQNKTQHKEMMSVAVEDVESNQTQLWSRPIVYKLAIGTKGNKWNQQVQIIINTIYGAPCNKP